MCLKRADGGEGGTGREREIFSLEVDRNRVRIRNDKRGIATESQDRPDVNKPGRRSEVSYWTASLLNN